MANGIAYGDALGAPNQNAMVVASMKLRAIRFLFLALGAEAIAIGAITWTLIDRMASRTLKLLIALGIATLLGGLTFALVRP